MSDAGRVDVLGRVVGADSVREAWAELDLGRRRAIVKALLSVEMRSPGKGSRPPRDEAGRFAHAAATMPITWR